jgi:hypothetical protein
MLRVYVRCAGEQGSERGPSGSQPEVVEVTVVSDAALVPVVERVGASSSTPLPSPGPPPDRLSKEGGASFFDSSLREFAVPATAAAVAGAVPPEVGEKAGRLSRLLSLPPAD